MSEEYSLTFFETQKAAKTMSEESSLKNRK